MQKRVSRLALVLALMVIVLIGCSYSKTKDTKDNADSTNESQFNIYFVDSKRSKLVEVPSDYDVNRYNRKEKIYRTNIYNLLQTLREDSDVGGGYRSIPASIVRNKVEYNPDNGSVIVDYTNSLYDLSASDSLLMRSAIVMTLTQLEGVSAVKITVNGEPLLDSNNQSVGYLTASDIITNEESYLMNSASYSIHLYFANSDGTGLVLEKRTVRLELGQSLPQVLLNEWMKGPETEGLLKINEGNIQINDVIERNGIAYVDFGKDFLKHQFTSRFTPEIVIYSIVNSLTDLTSVNQVQFLIDGEKVEKYRTLSGFNQTFSRNLDLIERG